MNFTTKIPFKRGRPILCSRIVLAYWWKKEKKGETQEVIKPKVLSFEIDAQQKAYIIIRYIYIYIYRERERERVEKYFSK